MPRKVIFRIVAGIVLAAAAGLAWRWYFSGPAVPEIPPEITDPAVLDAFQQGIQGVSQSPGSAQAWGHLGMVFNAYRYYDQANVSFARAEQLDPEDRRWPYFRGLNLVQKEPAEAIRLLKRAATLSTEAFEPRLRLAEKLAEVDLDDEADKAFRAVLEVQPDCLPAHLGLGKLAVRRGDFEGSLAHLKPATEGPETRQAAYRLLATAYQHLGRKEEAARAAFRARRLPKDVPWRDPILESAAHLRQGKIFLIDQANQLHEQGRFREALALLEEQMRKYPEDAWLLTYAIRELYSLGEVERAKEMIQRAIARKPDMIQPYFYKGRILFHEAAAKEKNAGQMGSARREFLAAADCFRRVANMKKDYTTAFFNLGLCYRKAGEPSRALTAFQDALRCRPEYAEAHTEVAELLVQQGNDAEALLHLGYAVKLALVDDPKPLLLLGALLARTIGRQ